MTKLLTLTEYRAVLSERDRLKALNAELLAALEAVMAEYEDGYGLRCVNQVRAAINKAKS